MLGSLMVHCSVGKSMYSDDRNYLIQRTEQREPVENNSSVERSTEDIGPIQRVLYCNSNDQLEKTMTNHHIDNLIISNN